VLTHIIRGEESIGESGTNGGGDVYNRSAEPVLVSSSNSYSEGEEISISDSKPSSCLAYTVTDYFIY